MPRKFKFALGDVVRLDPTGEDRTAMMRGKVIGRTAYIDGSHGYVVSIAHTMTSDVRRHSVAECEMVLISSAGGA